VPRPAFHSSMRSQSGIAALLAGSRQDPSSLSNNRGRCWRTITITMYSRSYLNKGVTHIPTRGGHVVSRSVDDRVGVAARRPGIDLVAGYEDHERRIGRVPLAVIAPRLRDEPAWEACDESNRRGVAVPLGHRVQKSMQRRISKTVTRLHNVERRHHQSLGDIDAAAEAKRYP